MKMSDFNEVINKVCGEIPVGYQIVIECENGAGYANMILPNSNIIVDGYEVTDGGNVEAQILELLNIATA